MTDKTGKLKPKPMCAYCTSYHHANRPHIWHQGSLAIKVDVYLHRHLGLKEDEIVPVELLTRAINRIVRDGLAYD